MRTMTKNFDGSYWTIKINDIEEVDSITCDNNTYGVNYVGYDDVSDEYHYNFTDITGVIHGLIVDYDSNGKADYFYPIDIIQ